MPFVTAADAGAALFTEKADTAVVDSEDRDRAKVTVTAVPLAVAELTVGAVGVLLAASSANAATARLFASTNGLDAGGAYVTRTAAVRLTGAASRSVSVEPLAETLDTVRLSAPLAAEKADLAGKAFVSSEPVNATASVQPVTVAVDACAGVVLVSVSGSNDAARFAGLEVSWSGELV